MTHIAFIGLGHMGAPMAQNLVRHGFDLLGYDIVPELRALAAERQIPIASSAAEAVTDAGVVLTMLPEGRHVLQAYVGDENSVGLIDVARQGSLFLECSTISVAEAQRAAALAVAAGHRALDAPVSGGVVGAEQATLAFMVGGEIADFTEALPLFEAMGRRVVHCGASGLGQAAKVCNNMILGVTQIAVAEAFVLGEQLGLEHQVLFDVASNASGQCWALTTNCPVPGPVPASPANHDYVAGFASTLMAKDLGLAEQAIEHTGVDARLGLAARRRYVEFATGDEAHQDFSAIINAIRDAHA